MGTDRPEQLRLPIGAQAQTGPIRDLPTEPLSSAEQAVAVILSDLGVKYASEESVGSLSWRFDFVLPELGTVLDVHGCYWHGCLTCPYGYSRALRSPHASGIRRHMNDNRRKAAYAATLAPEWRYAVIWEHELFGLRGLHPAEIPPRGKPRNNLADQTLSSGAAFSVAAAIGPRLALVHRF